MAKYRLWLQNLSFQTLLVGNGKNHKILIDALTDRHHDHAEANSNH